MRKTEYAIQKYFILFKMQFIFIRKISRKNYFVAQNFQIIVMN